MFSKPLFNLEGEGAQIIENILVLPRDDLEFSRGGRFSKNFKNFVDHFLGRPN